MNLGQRLVLLAGSAVALTGAGIALAPTSPYECGSAVVAAVRNDHIAVNPDIASIVATGHYEGVTIAATSCQQAGRAQVELGATLLLLAAAGGAIGYRLMAVENPAVQAAGDSETAPT